MMKNRIYITIACMALSALALRAQDYKIAKSTGRLEINIGRVDVEGTTGNEIIFSSSDRDKEKDERAKGLKEINSLGLEDNTGLGINVSEKGDVITVHQLKKTNSPKIRIQVPKGVIVSYDYESQYGGEVSFKNMENEIEVSAQYNSVQMENCSGPVTAKTIYGHVEADFNANTKGPISIVSIYGFADVTLPQSIKANLRMSTSYGEIFVAPEFKIEMDRSAENERMTGKINGGGMSVDLSCSYGKVYLRKK
jgi:hypothetical protein